MLLEHIPKFLLKLRQQNLGDPNVVTETWISLPPHKRPKSWDSIEDPVVPLLFNLYGHPIAGLLWDNY